MRSGTDTSNRRKLTIDTTDDVFIGKDGKPRRIRGVTVNSASSLLVTLAAHVGFETIWIESEHGPIGFEQAETLCLAAEAGRYFSSHQIVRRERHHVLRALEIGARIILVPMVNDSAYARRIVEVGKYAPSAVAVSIYAAAVKGLVWRNPWMSWPGQMREPTCSLRSKPRRR